MHKTHRRLSVLALVCFAFGALAMPAGAVDPEKLLPSDAEMVVTINMQQILGSKLFKKYGEDQVKAVITNDQRVADSLKALGLDPLKDVHSITVSNSGEPTGQKVFAIVRGKFDVAKISQTAVQIAAKEPNFKIRKESGMDIYEGSADGQPVFGTFVGNDALVISPSKDYLVANVKAAGKKPVAAPLAAAIKSLDAKKSMNMAALVTAQMRQALASNPQTAGFANKLTALTSSINVTDSAQATVNIHTNDAKAARQVGLIFQQVVPLLKVLAQGNEEFGPIANDLLGSLKVGMKGKTVSISLKITEEMVLKALQNQGN